ncbi:XRE family transcriptional regulator [Kribbella sindirgiensis]|uniref:XRE family transcriptional regulator n=1 Tax=Kribbella sindirgiensis TaxID=1124744 RepID=A0A4R0JBV0_9ACTN|nr:XRE family transcriptional regulator [Kribbella sindirgiensis]
MTTNPSSSARKAQETLGIRLRDLRMDAGLTGRELAAATGWHFTRVSKLEHGVQAPTDQDIRTWCTACNVPEQIPDLIAQARAVSSMYVEWRRQARAGMKQMMLSTVPLYERTKRFRIYELNVIPGLFQTADYTRAMLAVWIEFLDTHDDLDAAVAAKMARQAVVYDSTKTFAVLLEEASLRTWSGGAETMLAQLDRLLSVMTLPNVSLGIVPSLIERQAVGSAGFWIFDDKLVGLETPTAKIEVTQPQEIALYARTFEQMTHAAVYGRDARAIIINLQAEIDRRN